MTTMTLNTNLNGIELYFDEKPADAVREAMKALGFRWHAKKSMWWAKQTEARLALAEELCKADAPADKPAKGKGKKTTKKTETQADAPKASKGKQPKAEPKTEPKAEKPKAEPKKTKAEPKVEFSELSDKTTYTVVTGKGFETRKGYVFTATVGKTTLTLGVAKEKDKTWTLTELTTGISVGADYEKRFMAHKALEVKEVKSIAKMLKEEEYQKRAKALEKHNKKASK